MTAEVKLQAATVKRILSEISEVYPARTEPERILVEVVAEEMRLWGFTSHEREERLLRLYRSKRGQTRL